MTEHKRAWDPRVDDELRERAHCACGFLMAGLDMSAVDALYLRHLQDTYGEHAQLMFWSEGIHIDGSNGGDVEQAESIVKDLRTALSTALASKPSNDAADAEYIVRLHNRFPEYRALVEAVRAFDSVLPTVGSFEIVTQHLPPTCPCCSGIGHTPNECPTFRKDTRTIPVSVLTKHAEELRAMADDLRDRLGPIGTSLYTARSARAEAFDVVAARLERDARSG